MKLDLNLSLTQKPCGRFLINIQVEKKNPSIPIDNFYEYFINLNQYDSDDNDMLPFI